jgi:hypothetical protein
MTKKLLFLAVILRLLVAAAYFHPDIKTFNYQASFLRKGVFNIYTYLVDNKEMLPLKDEFVYFPLTYFTLGTYQFLTMPILGANFDSWLADAGANSLVKNPYIFKYLIVLKLPYLVLDIGIAYLLMHYFDDKKKGKLASLIWLFNPFTIILLYVFGNIDIIPAFLTLASFLMIKRHKPIVAALLFSIAAGFKLYPLLFLPFLILSGKNLKERLMLAGIPLLVFALITLPFASSAFVNSALVSGLSTRIFYPGIPIGFNESIIVGLLGVGVLFFYAYLVDSDIDLMKYWISIFLIIFSFSHFHIQWLTWIAPFMVILLVEKPKLRLTIFLVALLAFLIPPLYGDRSMTISLFRVYSTLYDILPTPFEVIQRFYDPYNLQSMLHTGIAAISSILIYKIYKERKLS